MKIEVFMDNTVLVDEKDLGEVLEDLLKRIEALEKQAPRKPNPIQEPRIP